MTFSTPPTSGGELTAAEALAILAERADHPWIDEEIGALLGRLWASDQRKFQHAASHLADHGDTQKQRDLAAAWCGVMRRPLTDGADQAAQATEALRDLRAAVPSLYAQPKTEQRESDE